VSDDTPTGSDEDAQGTGNDETAHPAVDGARGPTPASELSAAPATGWRRRTIALTAGVFVVVALVGAVVLRQPAPRPDGRVILYGDSLSFEASGAFTEEIERTTDAEIVSRVVPGLSPCDMLDTMADDLELEPTVVVIQYVGNNASECSRGPDGEELTGRALVDRYEADVRAATELFATNGVRVVLVGGPDAPGLPGAASLEIAEAYYDIANEWAGRDLGQVRYADAAATVTLDDGTYTDRLPCRDDEGADDGCAEGEVVVRSPDRVHFCPEEHGEFGCPQPAPGAVRFGEEMARVTRFALAPGY
jgi:hypothetical protein